MKIRFILPLTAMLSSFLPMGGTVPSLPKVEILGKEYYYHEVEKGESVYGVSRKYEWDLDQLVKLNPHVSREMKKGSRLYYPVDADFDADSLSISETIDNNPVSTVYHKVRRGETIYSISRQYGVPLEDLYDANPGSKYGVKAGSTVLIPQNGSNANVKYGYYTVKPGDTLSSIAKGNHVTIASVLNANQGISEDNIQPGVTLRINKNEESRVKRGIVEEERVASLESYKVKKNDSWESISKRTGVDAMTLREANADLKDPEKDVIISIPVVETVKVEKDLSPSDSRENVPGGVREMYDSLHRVDSDVRMLEEVNAALLLDDPNSKKDIDFTRGFLLALESMDDLPYKVNVKVIDGRGSTMAVTDALDEFSPSILIATADKSFPVFLADYGETNHLEIVNAFDVKNELYEENPSMIQLLTPSALFNEDISEKVVSEYGNRDVILLGSEETGDAILELIKGKIDGKTPKVMTIAEFSEFQPEEDKSYLLYSLGQKRDDAAAVLNVVRDLRERAPLVEITIVGRPSWVTMTDLFQNSYHEAEIIIPARCWVDLESGEGKAFVADFEEVYGQEPVKSFPNYAVSGFDAAKYFIKTTAENGGDYNRKFNDGTGLQSGFNLERLNSWSGFMNTNAYLLKFRPDGGIEKIPAR